MSRTRASVVAGLIEVGVVRHRRVRRPNVGAHPFDLAPEIFEVRLEGVFGIRLILVHRGTGPRRGVSGKRSSAVRSSVQ